MIVVVQATDRLFVPIFLEETLGIFFTPGQSFCGVIVYVGVLSGPVAYEVVRVPADCFARKIHLFFSLIRLFYRVVCSG